MGRGFRRDRRDRNGLGLGDFPGLGAVSLQFGFGGLLRRLGRLGLGNTGALFGQSRRRIRPSSATGFGVGIILGAASGLGASKRGAGSGEASAAVWAPLACINRDHQPGAGLDLRPGIVAIDAKQRRRRHAIALGDDFSAFALGDNDRRAAFGAPIAKLEGVGRAKAAECSTVGAGVVANFGADQGAAAARGGASGSLWIAAAGRGGV